MAPGLVEGLISPEDEGYASFEEVIEPTDSLI
jgi:hypothetical protein